MGKQCIRCGQGGRAGGGQGDRGAGRAGGAGRGHVSGCIARGWVWFISEASITYVWAGGWGYAPDGMRVGRNIPGDHNNDNWRTLVGE